MIRYFAYVLVISGVVFVPVTCTDISIEEPSDNEFQVLKGENVSEDLINEAFLPQDCDCGYHELNCSFTAEGEKICSCEPGFTTHKGICTELCNNTIPCQNGGTCDGGVCRCSKDYTGAWCETPTWCTKGKCGYENDVECLWDSFLQKGECRCKKDNYYYLPKDRKCYECECGDHGNCHVVDQMMECVCDKKYSVKPSKNGLKSSTCEYCDCGPQSEKCSFDSRGGKVCQCKENYASKDSSWSSKGTWCEMCDCGEHGRCSWFGDEKFCDCVEGFRVFEGKCRDCNCGPDGICEFDEFGEKNCSCDYGTAEHRILGTCRACDCYPEKRRFAGIECKFEDYEKKCSCPSGFETGPVFCHDIDECYVKNPCPANTVCINKPGTFECRCKEGFEPHYPWEDLKLSGCKDIDECLDFPCTYPRVECVNTPGSYDCVCRDGYYATSGNYGSTYKPAYNTCHEIETQWRQATIALGVIFSFGIITISYYIKKHKRSP